MHFTVPNWECLCSATSKEGSPLPFPSLKHHGPQVDIFAQTATVVARSLAVPVTQGSSSLGSEPVPPLARVCSEEDSMLSEFRPGWGVSSEMEQPQ